MKPKDIYQWYDDFNWGAFGIKILLLTWLGIVLVPWIVFLSYGAGTHGAQEVPWEMRAFWPLGWVLAPSLGIGFYYSKIIGRWFRTSDEWPWEGMLHRTKEAIKS